MKQDRKKSKFISFNTVASIAPPGCDEAVTFYQRQVHAKADRRGFSNSDIREMLFLGAAFPVTALIPQSAWTSYCRSASKLRLAKARRKEYPAFRRSVSEVLDIRDEREIDRLFREWRAQQVRRRFGFAGEYVRRGRKIDFSWNGLENITAALESGRGAIVWANQFMSQTLNGKRALWEAGLEPVQISVEEHGFSQSAFGIKTINRIMLSAEERYLKDRLLFERESGALVTRRILKHLDEGALILLTNNSFAGHSFAEIPIARDLSVSMATTALSIATRRGTPLLAMNTLETGAFDSYQINVSPVLNDPASRNGAMSGRDHEAMAVLALKARDHLLKGIRMAPEQYLGWLSIVPTRGG